MANLISPGVSVTITDESFFIPAAGKTLPLFFIATADHKKRPDNVTAAAGTYENNTVRTITSLRQSTELYGIPRFLEDTNGQQQHGDARNEYGLFALNQYLGVGDLAYVVRANVNLDDDISNIRLQWDAAFVEAGFVLENLVNTFITSYNTTNGYTPSSNTPATAGQQTVNVGGTITGPTSTGLTNTATVYTATVTVNGTPIAVAVTGSTAQTYTALLAQLNADLGVSATASLVGGNIRITSSTTGVSSTVLISADTLFSVLTTYVGINAAVPGTNAVLLYKTTVNQATFLSLSAQATATIWNRFSYRTLADDFTNDHTSSPFAIYPNGYNNTPVGTFLGLTGMALDWVANQDGGTVGFETEWTPTEAGDTLLNAADDLKFTLPFLYQTSLGSNDAARRVSIVTALQASINSNTDVRSEQYEFNLVLCPGFHEVNDELINLIIDIDEEAMAIGDTPMTMDPDQVVAWSLTPARATSRNIAYYYPHGLASNLDGKNVFISATGIALRVYTYSDEVSEVWFAPAGTRRGIVSGVTDVGYITGTLGSATTFVPVALSKGQKDNLYKYFTNINPIAFIPSRGIIIMGQKTSAPDASALDRVNVVRLLAYVKRQLRKNTLSFVFQPNDQLTRDSLKAAVDGFLGDLVVKRGLYDYASICDSSNNTPDRIDRNEMFVDIALKPVKSAEFIYIPIRVVTTGADIG